MGFRFRKRIKIAPGIHINIGKTGITSASIGKAGATLNVGKKGVKTTVGIPGTGLSYTSDNLISGKKTSTTQNTNQQADRLGFFADSQLLEDDQDEVLPTMPKTLTNKEYRKLSKAEKKAFKDAGGKVKFSAGEKIFIAFIVMAGIGWLLDRHAPAKTPEEIAAEAAKAKVDRAILDSGSNCVKAAKQRVKIPDSFDYKQPAVIALPNGKGYQVMLPFESKNAFGVSIPAMAACVTDTDGKLNSIKINR
ncbi:DUF4236 domain-containing protein [Salmonella enterica subsp. diarizonae]|nr:DUF4236 domain-containing protein [Salmonella enterica subsp. diarizonae]